MGVKYYQEEHYLNGDPTSLKIIEEQRNLIRENIAFEEERYSFLIDQYDLYVSKIIDFLKTFSFSSSIEYSIALSYLIHNGFLSENGKFYSRVSRDELSSRLGISVIMGSGCCRNLTFLQHEVISGLGFPSKKIYCTRDGVFIHGTKHCADHVIGYVEQNRIPYGLDIYNGNRLYRFLSPFQLSEISLTCNGKYYSKPYCEMIMDNISFEEMKKNIESFQKCDFSSWINPMEYEDDFRDSVMMTMKNHLDECVDFYESTKVLRKEIIHSYRKKDNE